MRILDRQRYWAFFKAYVICFIALVGLYVVIDAFSNLDEFAKRANGAVEMFQVMGRYYLVHMSQFYDRLCGVIGMMAAIFTVTWMQRNNELLAMLAAGISTQRVIRPVWISAIIVSLLAVLNQELIIRPVRRGAAEVARRRRRSQSPGLRPLRLEQYLHPRPRGRPGDADGPARSTPHSRSRSSARIHELDAEAGAIHPRRRPEGTPERGLAPPRTPHLNPPVHSQGAEGRPRSPASMTLSGFPRPCGDQVSLDGETYFLQTRL